MKSGGKKSPAETVSAHASRTPCKAAYKLCMEARDPGLGGTCAVRNVRNNDGDCANAADVHNDLGGRRSKSCDELLPLREHGAVLALLAL